MSRTDCTRQLTMAAPKRRAQAEGRSVPAVGRMALAVGLLAASFASWAQYKVIGPDGRVTYTDRPTAVEPGSRVQPVRTATGRGTSAEAAPPLPASLVPVVAKAPVSLVTSTDCAPCERARQLLRQRGIPHTERSATNDADGDALQRLSGGRTVPTLLVGAQVLRGLLDSDWHQALDQAGYPSRSALPATWPWRPAVPLAAAAGGAGAAGTAGPSGPAGGPGAGMPAVTPARPLGSGTNAVPGVAERPGAVGSAGQSPARAQDPPAPGTPAIRF